jgi:antitoxin component of RelBE/YafQ-DinJ toxin-antitoxin module
LSRITIDIPKIDHKKLKAIAALTGKSMREIIITSIEEHLKTAKILNKETRKAIEDAEKGKGLTKAKNAADLFKKLGI